MAHNPLKIVATLNELGKEIPESTVLFQEPQLISGIGDICQVHINYVTEPKHMIINFKLRIANMTTSCIENVHLVLETSCNLRIYPYQSAARTFFESLSTHEVVEWQVSAQLTSFDTVPKVVVELQVHSDDEELT